MKVHIIGPISANDRNRTGRWADYHVHAEGCGDCRRYHVGIGPAFEVADCADVASVVFEDIAAENDEDASTYLGEFYFAPCCDELPDFKASA